MTTVLDNNNNDNFQWAMDDLNDEALKLVGSESDTTFINGNWRPYSRRFKGGFYRTSNLEQTAMRVADADYPEINITVNDLPIDIIFHREVDLHDTWIVVDGRTFHRPPHVDTFVTHDATDDQGNDLGIERCIEVVYGKWALAMTEAEAYREGVTQEMYYRRSPVIPELIKEDGLFTFKYTITDEGLCMLESMGTGRKSWMDDKGHELTLSGGEWECNESVNEIDILQELNGGLELPIKRGRYRYDFARFQHGKFPYYASVETRARALEAEQLGNYELSSSWGETLFTLINDVWHCN
ncbi:hypothetical protein ACJ7VZ_05280 [Aeromonas salmonicida]|uniref:hypothetical protein n=1 Tax=Aeromonas salmonicida TaxID=645 RepID=UPI0038BDD249